MNDQGINENELLKKWLNPSMKEPAPEDFSQKVMNAIAAEKSYRPVSNKYRKGIVFPAAIVTILVLLMILSFFVSSEQGWMFAIIDKIPSTSGIMSLPAVSNGLLEGLQIPAIIVYISSAFVFLIAFDYALRTIFRKRSY